MGGKQGFQEGVPWRMNSTTLLKESVAGDLFANYVWSLCVCVCDGHMDGKRHCCHKTPTSLLLSAWPLPAGPSQCAQPLKVVWSPTLSSAHVVP